MADLWAPDDITGGDYARLVLPEGGGAAPTAFVATTDGRRVEIEWGYTVVVSSSVPRPGATQGRTTPALHIDVARALAANGQLEYVS